MNKRKKPILHPRCCCARAVDHARAGAQLTFNSVAAFVACERRVRPADHVALPPPPPSERQIFGTPPRSSGCIVLRSTRVRTRPVAEIMIPTSYSVCTIYMYCLIILSLWPYDGLTHFRLSFRYLFHGLLGYSSPSSTLRYASWVWNRVHRYFATLCAKCTKRDVWMCVTPDFLKFRIEIYLYFILFIRVIFITITYTLW